MSNKRTQRSLWIPFWEPPKRFALLFISIHPFVGCDDTFLIKLLATAYAWICRTSSWSHSRWSSNWPNLSTFLDWPPPMYVELPAFLIATCYRDMVFVVMSVDGCGYSKSFRIICLACGWKEVLHKRYTRIREQRSTLYFQTFSHQCEWNGEMCMTLSHCW